MRGSDGIRSQVQFLLALVVTFSAVRQRTLFADAQAGYHFDPPAADGVEAEVLRNALLLREQSGGGGGALYGGSIMVGSSHGLYRLDSSHLEQLDRRSLATPSRLLAADVSESSQGEGDDDDDGVVLHCDNAECAVVQLSNLSAPALRSIGASEVLNVEGTENVQVYGIVNGELLYGEREIPITDSEGAQAAKLTKANFDLGGGAGGQDFYSVEAVRKEKDPFTSLVFLSSFSEGNYTYFVVRLHWNGYKTRVIRICNSDEGNLGPGESLRSFVSYYEAELACSVGVDTDEILAYAAAFVESSGEVFGSTLLLSVSVLGEEDSSSYLCAYDLAEINSSMDNKFSDCISSSGTIGISRDSSTEMCISVTPEQIKQNVS